MNVLEFLQKRNIVNGKHKDLEIGFDNGTKESLTELIESYHEAKKEELLTDFIGIIQFDTKHETYEEDVKYYLNLSK